ncbi:N-acetylglucosamine-6-phosphate deacetylase [Clostridium niameyense]|uniref:N-acetylglucosamine-6-phosphate deacetylase n=1 Tax=Clostridium niameyense TaxID=1622073 RepID=A0A6M0REC2_9CLOT|nr:N-acetylglucosamine-6-phosphate deacetylase [Clostridium niameyense]NEZ48029.1 N-acetylglucosamine-6-phosphate deacetylase [Clostridium niameyense]
MKAIINCKIIKEHEILTDSAILFDKKIVNILTVNEFNELLDSNNIYIEEIIDAKDKYVSPGFIDTHIHGSGGKDSMDGTIEDIKVISEAIVKYGVTSFIPTTMTMSKEKIYNSLEAIKMSMDENFGAKVLGAHMEGPFINEKYKGAQKADYIVRPSYDFIDKYKDIIKIITMAPEKDINFEFIKKVKKNTNIEISIGHSDATYEEAMDAIKNGTSRVTHMFNAMTPLHHRKPGVVGAVFNSNIYCELIADKIHVHPELFNTVLSIKGKDKVILITDSMRAGCMKDGIWELGGQKVIVQNGVARLEDGTLAGSILTLNKALSNIIDKTKLEINEAVNLLSLNPAKSLGIDHKKGSIEIGKDADMTIFDKDFNIFNTIVEGNIFKFNIN